MIYVSTYMVPDMSVKKQKTKKLLVAAAAGGNGGGGDDDISNLLKYKYTREQVAKMKEYANNNNIAKNNFSSILSHCKKFIKK